MTPREIIAKAWAITKKERPIRRWGYAAAIAETLLNIKLLIYQVWFAISYWKGDPIGFFTVEATLMEHVPFWLFLTFIITLIILLIIEWLLPNLSRGAIIGLAAKSYKGEEVKGGLVLAVYNFFPIFAIHEMFFLGRITVIITISSILLRYGGGVAPFAIGILVIFYILSNIFQFFCIFAEEAVVICRDEDNNRIGVGRALKQSLKMVISYLGQIVFLLLLFFVIVLRVVLNVVMVLLIPGIVIGIGFLLALVMPPIVGYSIATVLGLALVGVASYFFAYLAVFKQTVWTLTYLELGKLKELDVIEMTANS
ncbi:hypothetical protein KKF55_04805 [Patescibacteria group bacterium]|nr:hypothetical protein [Patescibacteria group bacterium]